MNPLSRGQSGDPAEKNQLLDSPGSKSQEEEDKIDQNNTEERKSIGFENQAEQEDHRFQSTTQTEKKEERFPLFEEFVTKQISKEIDTSPKEGQRSRDERNILQHETRERLGVGVEFFEMNLENHRALSNLLLLNIFPNWIL